LGYDVVNALAGGVGGIGWAGMGEDVVTVLEGSDGGIGWSGSGIDVVIPGNPCATGTSIVPGNSCFTAGAAMVGTQWTWNRTYTDDWIAVPVSPSTMYTVTLGSTDPSSAASLFNGTSCFTATSLPGFLAPGTMMITTSPTATFIYWDVFGSVAGTPVCIEVA